MSERKTAVIVGANGNLGRATCAALEEAGFDIDPAWRSDDRPDAANAGSYENLPKKIHFAAYLAGVNVVEDTQNLKEEDWARVMATNLTGAFLFAKAAFPGLAAAGHSSFVGISSINTMHPYPRRAAYVASKAGLEGLIRELAVEWGAHGIATHCIRLGHLHEFMRTTKPNPGFLAAVKSHTPSGELIPAEAVASYMAWLANGGARYISGSVIDFDPAYTLNRIPI